MPESVFTQTIPALLAGGGCVRAAGFAAGVEGVPAVLPPEAGVAEGAGLLAGAVETAGVVAGVAAAVEAGSAEADFFERLFFGAAALFSADVAVLAGESSAAVFLIFFWAYLCQTRKRRNLPCRSCRRRQISSNGSSWRQPQSNCP